MLEPADLGLPQAGWRTGQWELLSRLAGVDAKTVLLQAPTGTGKSLIAVGLAKLLGYQRILILVGTKQLQDQYAREFSFIKMGKGRQNFPCWVESGTAETARCAVGDPCPHKGQAASRHDSGDNQFLGYCPYYAQLHEANGAQFAVLNYAFFMSMANLGEQSPYFSGYDLVIADECHLLEDNVRQFASVDITNRMLLRFGIVPDELEETPEAWLRWAYRVREPHVWNSIPQKTRQDKIAKRRLATSIRFLEAANDPEAWVVEEQSWGRKMKPVWVSPMLEELVYRHGQRWLLMSATILDAALLAEQLALDVDETTYVEAPSTFDPRRRPLYYWPAGKVSFKNPQVVDTLADHVASILDKYPDAHGLIHTSSYKLAHGIMERVRSERLVTHDSRNRAEVIAAFQRTPGAVLVSPSVTTGVDLPYDACRFQVIAKLPFPDKSDPQLAKRLKLLPNGQPNPYGSAWYGWLTLCALIQAYGRGMRAADDQCDTWLLDGNWYWFRRSVGGMIPDWFRVAIRFYEEDSKDDLGKELDRAARIGLK